MSKNCPVLLFLCPPDTGHRTSGCPGRPLSSAARNHRTQTTGHRTCPGHRTSPGRTCPDRTTSPDHRTSSHRTCIGHMVKETWTHRLLLILCPRPPDTGQQAPDMAMSKLNIQNLMLPLLPCLRPVPDTGHRPGRPVPDTGQYLVQQCQTSPALMI